MTLYCCAHPLHIFDLTARPMLARTCNKTRQFESLSFRKRSVLTDLQPEEPSYCDVWWNEKISKERYFCFSTSSIHSSHSLRMKLPTTLFVSSWMKPFNLADICKVAQALPRALTALFSILIRQSIFYLQHSCAS